MLTIFSTPKAFEGHFAVIQRNAIRSWTLLEPRAEVLLLGDEAGTAEVARELGVRHLPQVPCNEYGTPRIDEMFAMAERESSGDTLCYVNADIVLTDVEGSVGVASRAHPRFLLVGRRWNLDVDEPLSFDPDWRSAIRSDVERRGELAHVDCIDYFVFTRGLWPRIPAFAIGRTAWDNWLVFGAREVGAAVIDASESIFAVHQNHDYAHRGGTDAVWKGPEAVRNLALAGGEKHCFTLGDATHRIVDGRVRRIWTIKTLRRHLYTLDILRPSLQPVAAILRAPMHAYRAVRRRLHAVS